MKDYFSRDNQDFPMVTKCACALGAGGVETDETHVHCVIKFLAYFFLAFLFSIF